ncbi:MAG TPA: N-acetylmuramoyl-L-alanine amidase [Clostridium sp.]|uniref:N-acetylmuramoyl-L-alanine amidase family protein n=1 Tax=Clostridium sp. TaxID=1506 RepID=UPI002F93372F
MLKKKNFILVFVLLVVIGGALYGTNYTTKKQQKELAQVIKVKQEESKAKIYAATKAILTTKTLAEKKALVRIEKKKKNTSENSQKIIVIDPGHGSVTSSKTEHRDPVSSIMKIIEPGGGQGINTKTPEYVVNMAVALKLKSLLQAKGYKVEMTKTQNSVLMGSKERAAIGNAAHAALVIRIHADGNNNLSVNGASMLVPADAKYTDDIYKVSKKYGQIVFNNLIKDVGMNNRGVVERSDMTGFNWSDVPVILVEMGFQSNAREDKLLTTGSYQEKLAQGLADGINQALK